MHGSLAAILILRLRLVVPPKTVTGNSCLLAYVAKVIVSPSQTDMMEQQILSFCGQQRTWLQLELAAEDEKDLEEARSQVLHNLLVSDICVGLYGRTVLRLITPLAPSSATAAFLPVHR